MTNDVRRLLALIAQLEAIRRAVLTARKAGA